MDTLRAISDLTFKAADYAGRRQSMIRQALEEGSTYSEVASAAGITIQRVGIIAKQNGLAGRKQGRPRRRQEPT